MRVRLTVLVMAMLALVPVVSAQEPEPAAAPAAAPDRVAVSVQLDPQEVKLGERFTLIVRVTLSGSQGYRLPDVLDLSPFVETARSQGREQVDGHPVQVFRLTLVTYEEVGQLRVPGFALQPEGSDGGTAQEIQVPESTIQVASVLEGVEKPTLRDVAPPVSISVADYRLLVYLGFLLIWTLLALTLRFWLARTRTEKRLEVLPPVRLAHEIALEKLNQVVQDDLLRKGRVHEYFVRVSETIREYLGNRYGFYALDLTTRELLEELRDRPTPGLEHARLSRLLSDADLVKFAKLHPSDDMSSTCIDGAFHLVQQTRQIEEQVSE